jgi:hypothetical protein
MSEQVAIEVIEGASVTVEVVEDGGVEVVEVIHPGPQGPAGGVAYVHTQSTPSTTWTINHNLGFRPTVELLDAGSQEIDGEVAHPSVNQTVVTLKPATAGLARLT